MSGIPERVRQCLTDHGVKGPIVVAVSGGPDSVCLLHVLRQLREDVGIEPHVAHLDHRLHAQALAHAHYVARLCRRLGIRATIEARDVGAYRRERRLSLEEAARQVRYAFLAQVAYEVGATCVATGHTADDQVETVLMHLLRGAGWVGLQGMAQAGPHPYAPGSPLRLLRPLLGTSKAETGAYCRAHHLRPRQDPTNVQLSLLRNRVRHALLPLLEKYNPRISEALLRLSEMARDQVSLLDGLVREAWPRVVAEDAGGLRISSPHLIEQPPAVRQHLLRRAIERLLGSFTDFEAHHLERLEAALRGGAGRSTPLPRGLRAITQHHALYLTLRPTTPLPPLEGEHPLNVPGATPIPGWTVATRLLPVGGTDIRADSWRAVMHYEPGMTLWVRTRRPGDRFQPLGMAEAKKLQDFMVDAHIPREWRDRVPLVCSPQGIAWVVGWRLAEWARVRPDSLQVLEVELKRTEAGS